MAYLLNLLYATLLIAASPWLVVSAIRKGKYRTGFGEKLWGLVPKRTSPDGCIWLHAVSMGEVSLIAPLIAEFQARHPSREIVISTTTLTGYTLAKSRYRGHIVFYAPLDFSWAVRRAVRRIRPALLVLVELELWPNLIAAAQQSGAKVAVVNGRLSDNSFRGYRRLRPLAHRVFARLDLVAAQNPMYADRFLECGARSEAVFVTGSLKFDGAQTDCENAATRELRQLAGLGASDVVFLAGSTQEPEERLALTAFRELSPTYPELRLIVVPRHPDRFNEVARLLDESHVPWQRRSMLDREPADPQSRVLLVDRVGELASWWGTTSIAYVGGSMGNRNGQNMIEPAAFGAAVSFGPKTRNFRDVVAELLDRQAAVVVHDSADLTGFVRRCLSDHAFAVDLGAKARRVVAGQLGATKRTADLLDGLMASERAIVPERRAAA